MLEELILRLPFIGQLLYLGDEKQQLFFDFLREFVDGVKLKVLKVLCDNTFYINKFGHFRQTNIILKFLNSLKVVISILVNINFVSWKFEIVEDVKQYVAKGYEVVSPRSHFEIHLMLRGESYVSLESVVFFLTNIIVMSTIVHVLGSETKINKYGVKSPLCILLNHNIRKFEVVISSIGSMNNLELVYNLGHQFENL